MIWNSSKCFMLGEMDNIYSYTMASPAPTIGRIAGIWLSVIANIIVSLSQVGSWKIFDATSSRLSFTRLEGFKEGELTAT